MKNQKKTEFERRMDLVQMAKNSHFDACDRLQAYVNFAFPIGATVDVTIGRSTFPAVVVAHGSILRLGYIRIQNERTGKLRWFDATWSHHSARVVSPLVEREVFKR